MQKVQKLFLFIFTSLLFTFSPAVQFTFAQQSPDSLQQTFKDAAKEFNVPEDILLSVSYNVSRWEDHNGKPSTSGGYGPMHLTDIDNAPFQGKGEDVDKTPSKLNDPMLHTLNTAAKELQISPDTLKNNPKQNIRAGAYLLHRYAQEALGKDPSTEADWYSAVAKYSGSDQEAVASDFADTIYATIREGKTHQTVDGQVVKLEAKKIQPNKEEIQTLHLKKLSSSEAECPLDLICKWASAAYYQNNPNDSFDYGNYEIANREQDGLNIRYIVIHDTETPYTTAINIFQNPLTYVSAHYVLRSSDGEVTQMVKNKDVALHAGNWWINMHSIGIEHEGYAIEGATWYTEFMYRSSAKLTRWLAQKYDIPLDRAHIVGHDEYSGPTAYYQGGMHWDPGTYWDWEHYMELVGSPIVRHELDTHNTVEGVVTINPEFEENLNAVKTCDGTNTERAAQPTNFVHLYTEPNFTAPLIKDPSMPDSGTIRACDWGDKATIGQQFYRIDRVGDWDAIYYSGQKAWFYNPEDKPTASLTHEEEQLVTPKATLTSIPVYGRAYPEISAYHPSDPEAIQPIRPLQYSIPAGQKYVVIDKVKSDYYKSWYFGYNPNATDDYVVKGKNEYFTIFFNHRFAFVKATDVDVVEK